MAYDLSVAEARNPLIAITVFATIAIVFTGLRLQSRRIRRVPFASDDYLMVAALLFFLVSIVIEYVCVFEGGLGRHIKDVQPAALVITLKLILPIQILYAITLCLLKSSVICFYLRVFGDKYTFRKSAYAAIVVLVMWAIMVILEALLLCRPLAFNWDSTVPGGVCGDRNKVYISSGALNLATDFMVIALPVPHILRLELALRRKLGVLVIFTMGIFITIISIIRLRCIQTQVSFADPTFGLCMAIFWSTMEPCLCIINANLPMVRAFFVDLAPRVFSSTERGEPGVTRRSGWRGRGMSLFESTRSGRDVETGRNEAAAKDSQKSTTSKNSAEGMSQSEPE